MDGLPAQAPVAVIAQAQAAACSGAVSDEEAQAALKAISQAMPKTNFLKAWPSCVPGMVALKLANGTTAYTDRTARYLVVGLVFDTATGNALDRQMAAQPN